MPPLDEMFLRINEFAARTTWLHAPATAYAKYGIALFAGLIVVGWWQARSGNSLMMAAALLTPVAAVIAFAAQQLVVALVSEQRPYSVHPDALVLVGRTTDSSFPSDHACVAAAVAAGLFFVNRRLGWLAAVLALLMAVTRVYVARALAARRGRGSRTRGGRGCGRAAGPAGRRIPVGRTPARHAGASARPGPRLTRQGLFVPVRP